MSINNSENKATREWIIKWFEENTVASRQDLLDGVHSNYFERGWIDSFKFMSFIMEIESELDVTFSNDEFQYRDFSTIDGLAKILNKRMQEKNAKV